MPNQQISTFDKVTMIVAVLALLASIFSIYFQYFQNTTELSIGNVDFFETNNEIGDTINYDIKILLLNTGDNGAAITIWSTFLSPNTKFNWSCSGNEIMGGILEQDSTFYTFGCSADLNQVIEPNTVKFVSLNLRIDSHTAIAFINKNKALMKGDRLNLGVQMRFVDSKGIEKRSKIIAGQTTFSFYETNDSILFKNTSTHHPELSEKYKVVY